MKLADIIAEEAIISDLEARDRDGAIKETVAKLVEIGQLDPDVETSVVAGSRAGLPGRSSAESEGQSGTAFACNGDDFSSFAAEQLPKVSQAGPDDRPDLRPGQGS